MTRDSFPEIPQQALKSHAQPARIERVWRRLELDVSRPRLAIRAPRWWLPAGALGVFALGVLVGARFHTPAVEVSALAEPAAALPATGTGALPEPEASAAPQPEVAPQKHARSRHALPVSGVADGYAEAYGDASGLVASQPALPAPSNGDPAEWEKLAEAGDFRAAKVALDREGSFEHFVERAAASQLLVLADIARASGDRERAARALRRVLSTYLSAPEAPLAAWTLGNLLEQAGDRAGADEAYATYRRLSPTGDFAEDAAARQVDAALSQGNLELGARALDEYAQNFPKGRRLAELRKRLVALEAPADPADPAAPAATPTDADEDDEGSEPAAEAPAAPAAAAAAREH